MMENIAIFLIGSIAGALITFLTVMDYQLNKEEEKENKNDYIK